jgi:ribosomal protein L37AE/L43A
MPSHHESDRSTRASGVDDPAAAEVSICPFCQSDRVATTSKSVSDATYWRCHACGEIWNPARCVVRGGPRSGRPR